MTSMQYHISSQCQWYVYSPQCVAKVTFEEVFVIDMLKNTARDSPGKGKDIAIMGIKSLKKYVKAEFAVFVTFLKLILEEKSAVAKGNPFAQLIHDGGTLASKRKYQTMGMQWTDVRWRKCWTVCIGLVCYIAGKDE